MKIDIEIGNLATIIEEFRELALLDNQEVGVSDYNITVDTPYGESLVNYFIKKCNLPVTKVTLANGYSFIGANKHIVRTEHGEEYLDQLSPGSFLVHRDGYIRVESVSQAGFTDCYDISIPGPHLYYDTNGVVHHNTLVTATLSYCCEPYGRTIVIVPNKNLIRQTYDDYINLGLDAGVFYGDRKEFGHKHTIVTWQSLNVLLKASKKDNLGTTIEEFIDGVICVMVDECHGLKADVLTAILTGCMSNIPIRWGFTGTEPEEKMNQYSLLVSIGPIINRISASELQEAGILSNCHVKIKQLVDFVEYKTYQEELRYLLDNEERLKYISSMIEEYSLDGNTLVLVDRVAAGKALAECIDGAVFVSGATKADDRKDEYDSIATGDNQVLVATYGVAAVGINIVRLHNVVLVEPGKSFIRVIQSIGRGLRKGFEKDFVQIYDITSTCKFAKRHLLARKKFYAKANYKYSVEKVNWQ